MTMSVLYPSTRFAKNLHNEHFLPLQTRLLKKEQNRRRHIFVCSITLSAACITFGACAKNESVLCFPARMLRYLKSCGHSASAGRPLVRTAAAQAELRGSFIRSFKQRGIQRLLSGDVCVTLEISISDALVDFVSRDVQE